MSYDSSAIANYFLDLAKTKGEALTQMKLQKLVYLAHGWHLALTQKPLIDEPVEAWKFGPVIRSLYREFSDFGSEPITRRAKVFDGTSLQEREPSLNDLRDEDHEFTRKILDRVWKVYGSLSAAQLSRMTHQKDTPWDETWRDGEKFLKIEEPVIEKHFQRMASNDE